MHCTKNEVFHYGFLQQMWLKPQFPADLVTFTEEILNGRLYFLISTSQSDCSCYAKYVMNFSYAIMAIPLHEGLEYLRGEILFEGKKAQM